MRIYVLALSLFCSTLAGVATDWPQWGGPNRNFIVSSPSLVDGWDAKGPKILWKRPLGSGYAAPAVRDGVVYALYNSGREQAGPAQDPLNKALIEPLKNDGVNAISALDAATGKTLWTYTYPVKTYTHLNLDFGTGPNASPLLLKDRLVSVGFAGELICLDLKGNLLWSHQLVEDFNGEIPYFGYSVSPLGYKDKIIVLVGGKEHSIAAFNPENGAMVASGGPYDISHASPKLMNVDGLDQIIFFGADSLRGVHADSLKLLWEYPVTNQYHNNSTDPIPGPDNLLWVPAQLDAATRVLKLKREGETIAVEQLWHNPNVKNHYWNSILLDGYVYSSIGSGSSSMLACIELKTGEIKWRERGFDMANSVYADGKLIFLDHNGTLVMGRVTPEKWTLLSQTSLLEKEARTGPVLVGSILYARDVKHLVAVDLGR